MGIKDLQNVVRTGLAGALFAVLSIGCGSSGGSNNNNNGEEPECADGTFQCSLSNYQACEGGQWVTQESCSNVCNAELGCVDCNPGGDFCDGLDVVTCNADGTRGSVEETCTNGLVCANGDCINACEEAAATRSYIGCDYIAADLQNATEVHGEVNGEGTCTQTDIFGGEVTVGVRRDDLEVCYSADPPGLIFPGPNVVGTCENGGECPSGYGCEVRSVCVTDAQNAPFAVVVSNPQGYDVDLTLSAAGMTQNITLSSGEVRAIYPQQLGFPDQSLLGSGISPAGYRIQSTAPVVAYQFNPLDNVDVFSNDGSLLIPTHAYDTRYLTMTWPSLVRRGGGNPLLGSASNHDYNGYIVVTASEDGTEVTVTPKAEIRKNTGFDGIPAGQTVTFTLNALDVLHLEAVGDGDLTGSVVEVTTPDKTVGVFGGHQAVVIANNEDTTCCADHIEEMMFPTSTWGKDYVIARSESRGQGEPDLVRILASADGTTVQFDPAPISGSCPTLNSGEHCDVRIMNDTQIAGSNPILVGHYLLSVLDQAGNGSGDPSMALAVPFEQYRTNYSFLVPAEYDNQYISVVASTGTTVGLDGQDITSQLTPLPNGVFSAARIQVQPGQHTLECPGGRCGLEVYGYSDAVSYLFAGGLDLQQISIE